MMGLTPRQADCLRAIEELTAEGVSPTYAQIAERIGVTSKSVIHRLVVGLERRGHLRRRPHCQRALEVMSTVTPGLSKDQIANEICRLVWEWSGRTRPTDELFPRVLGALQ